MEKQMMKIVNIDGTSEEVEVILSFSFTDTNKKYLIYTKNETDDKGNITIYSTMVTDQPDGTVALVGIDTDEEWNKIKDILRELSKNDD